MFFHYSQNNSGGSFDYDEARGITHHVVIEADSQSHSNDRAEAIGLYFDGSGDCPCCGNRWYETYDDGSEHPTVYGSRIGSGNLLDGLFKWMEDGRECCIHYADGRMEWVGCVVKEPA